MIEIKNLIYFAGPWIWLSAADPGPDPNAGHEQGLLAYGVVAEEQVDHVPTHASRGDLFSPYLMSISLTHLVFLQMMHPFWPTKPNEEMHFDDFSVTLLKQFDLSNCFEYSLKLTMLGSDAVQELSALQLKTWAQNVPSQVVAVARDVITSYKQRVMSESGVGVSAAGPIVINCLTGSKRSPLVAVTVAAVLATKAKRPLLINVVDAWFRIAAQRRGVLENEKELEYSFQVVLSNGHDLLNKREWMGVNRRRERRSESYNNFYCRWNNDAVSGEERAEGSRD